MTSIDATGSELRSWNGIAGTIAVPEPSATALGAGVLCSVAFVWRRGARGRP